MSGFFFVVGKVLFLKTGNFLGNISIIYMQYSKIRNGLKDISSRMEKISA